MIQARTTSVDDTRALAAEVAPLATPGRPASCWPATWARARPPSSRASPGAWASPSRSPAPPSSWSAPTRAASRSCTSTSTASSTSRSCTTWASPSCSTTAAVTVIEWGDVVAPALPADFLEVRLEPGDEDDDERLLSLRWVGPGWPPRVAGPPPGGRGLGRAAARPSVGDAVLGIETATTQVGCAVGGHEGVLAEFHSARGRRHVETLVPAIEFVCRQARVDLSRDLGRRRRHRPRPVQRAAGGRGHGQGHGPGPAGAHGRRVQPRPAGLPRPLQQPADRPRHRRPPGRALLRLLPPGAGRRPAAVALPAGHGRGAGVGAAGPGRGLPPGGRRRRPLPGRCSARWPGFDASGDRQRPTRRPPSLVELAHPRAIREEFVPPPELEPLYLRRSDAEINWDRDERSSRWCRRRAGRASRREPSELVVHLVPMRRRHLRSVLRIEAQVYPRPWSLGLFMSELALRNSRAYYVARVDGVVVGYGGLMVSGDDGHITTLAVDPAWHRRKIGSRLLLALAREGVSPGRGQPHPRGAGGQRRRPGALPAVRLRAPPASARTTTSRRTRMPW